MNKILITIFALTLFIGTTLAQSGGNQGNGTGQGQNGNNQGNSPMPPLITPTQNEMDVIEPQVAEQKERTLMPKDPMSKRNMDPQAHMSIVAQRVQEILENKDIEGGIGQQVRVIAQQQNETQQHTQVQLERLKAKDGVGKLLFGPDLNALKEMQKIIEQNKTRIVQLEQLKTQTEGPAEKELIEEMVTALTEQNTALKQQVVREEGTASLFGWLVKMFGN